MKISRFFRVGMGVFALMLALNVSAFADSVDTNAAKLAGGGGMCYGCGGGSQIDVTASKTVYAQPDGMTINADYYISAKESSEEQTRAELNKKIEDIQTTLRGKASVKTTQFNVWPENWGDGIERFTGNVSFLITPTEITFTGDIKEKLTAQGIFNVWMNPTFSDNMASAESEAIPELKAALKARKGIYEELFEITLDKFFSVNIWSWADQWTYDAETNTVAVTVNASIMYYAPEMYNMEEQMMDEPVMEEQPAMEPAIEAQM